jgi:hypothetical protein
VNAKGLIVKSEKKEDKDRKNREKGIKKITDKLEHIFFHINKRKYKKHDEELSFDFWVIDDLVKEDSKLDGKYIIVTNLEIFGKLSLIKLVDNDGEILILEDLSYYQVRC